MNKLLTITLTNLRILFQSKGIWINLLIVPIGISLAVGLANGASFGGDTPAVPKVLVDIIDRDSTPESAAFVADLKATNPQLVVCPADNDGDVCGLSGAVHNEALANERLEARETLALLIIPDGFADALASGASVTLTYRSNEDMVAPSYIRQSLDVTVQRWSAAQVAANVGADVFANFDPTANLDRAVTRAELLDDANTLWDEDLVRIDFASTTVTADDSQPEGFSQSVPGIATMYVMFSVLPLIGATIVNRRNWTYQRLVMMPVSRAQVLGGMLLTYFLLGIIQYAVLFGFGKLLDVDYGNDPVALVVVMIAFTTCITTLALALTTFIRNENQAAGITLFITMTLAPLGGAWWPLEVVPDWMRAVGHISPVAWAMDAFRSLIFYDGSLATILLPVAVLLAMAAVFFGVGMIRFQAE